MRSANNFWIYDSDTLRLLLSKLELGKIEEFGARDRSPGHFWRLSNIPVSAGTSDMASLGEMSKPSKSELLLAGILGMGPLAGSVPRKRVGRFGADMAA